MKQLFVVLLATLILCDASVGGGGKKSTGAANQQHPTKDSAGSLQVQSTTVAGVPQLMSHQGYVADNTGTGITGTLPMTFRMYDDSTAGSLLLTQSFPSVALTKGVFNVNIDVSTLSFSSQYWLETEVNSQTLAPRARLTSAPYSLAPWQTNGTTVYYNGGKVGIGTNNPASDLHIKGLSPGMSMDNTDYSSGVSLLPPGVNYTGGVGTFTNHDFPIFTDNQDRITVKANGNVGIGNPAPYGKLDVLGINGSQFRVFDFPPSASQLVGEFTGSGASAPILRFENSAPGFIDIGLTPSGAFNIGGGNVGIGKSNPSYSLDVNGAVNATQLLVNGVAVGAGGSQWSTNGSNISYNSGNVGIGTTTPVAKLSVGGIGTFDGSTISIGGNTGDPQERIILRYDCPGYCIGRLTTAPNVHLGLGTNGVNDRLYINTSGDVGIGTTTPSDKLTVSGTVAATSLKLGELNINPNAANRINYITSCFNTGDAFISSDVWACPNEFDWINFKRGSTGTRFRVSQAGNGYFAGNVGIGTANPQSKLAVNGTITAKQVDVTLGGWADFVFADDYKLPDLESVEQHIKQFKHLPDVPSEQEVLRKGVDLGKMQSILLQKIEELTLYVIELKKKNDALEKIVVSGNQ
jgi:hypothetical protein